MSTRTFGEPIKRNEDRRLLTGQALFIDDIELPGMLHAAFLRSQVAHARILKIDVSRALQRPGVVAAYVLYRPCVKVTCLLGLIPLRLKAYWVIGFWAVWQVVEIANQEQNGVAYWAHIGGLITGAVLFYLLRPPGVALLECAETA